MTKEKLIHFLLVEDDPDHAHLITRIMKKNRVKNTIQWLQDGQAALDYLHRRPPYEDRKQPDVILLDLQLPLVDGIEVLENIKQSEELRKIPVVMLTTSNVERDRLRAYSNHVNSYVVKPLDFDIFKSLINDMGFYWGLWNQ